MSEEYEVVVGGGPGGLTTALYTTRLGHDTALVDRGGGGRQTAVEHVHSLISVSEEVPEEIRENAREVRESDEHVGMAPPSSEER